MAHYIPKNEHGEDLIGSQIQYKVKVTAANCCNIGQIFMRIQTQVAASSRRQTYTT